MADLTDSSFDRLLDTFGMQVSAFAVCEIGRNFSLQCVPHDEIVIHFVLKGEGFLECNSGRFALGTGTVTIVPSGTRKRLSGVGPIRHLVPAGPACMLGDGIMRFAATDDEPGLLLGCATLGAGGGGRAPLAGELDGPVVTRLRGPTVVGLFSAMLEEVRRPRAGTRAFLSATMQQLLIMFLREDFDRGGPLASSLPQDPRLRRAVAAVLCEPGAMHSLRTMAMAAAMSRSRFIEHFSAAYGCAPMAFVRSARLSSAARMLADSDLPIKSVAAATGYASRSQFSRAFRGKFGKNPSEFRSSARMPLPMPPAV